MLSGSLKVQIGDHTEILNEGDSIYYNSSTPHGMIAVDGRDCLFVAVVLPGLDRLQGLAFQALCAGLMLVTAFGWKRNTVKQGLFF